MKIYTRTGDEGMTGLYGGARVSKISLRIQAIGDVDELNASLGVARVATKEADLDAELGTIQNRLFNVGSELATPSGKSAAPLVDQTDIERLERSMDELSAGLPPLTQFILPGGSAKASVLHLSRCICRRAERSVLELHEIEPLRAETRIFLNRLSDWLFVAARTANARQLVADIPWKQSEHA